MVVDLRAQPELANVRAITNLTVVYADAEAARIFEHSQRAAAELPDFSPGIRKAASVGRQLLDPLLEFCGLWNPQSPDVLFLRARPPHEPQGVPDLQYLKGQVDEGELKKKLERVFLNVVNAVGFVPGVFMQL
jgi:transcriptional accessory protein Tex/SPT6